MTDYDNNMRGVLFKNDRKESDNHPDYKGNAEVDGFEYWLAAWIKTGAKGKYMSLSFTEKEARNNPPPREPVKQTRDQQREQPRSRAPVKQTRDQQREQPRSRAPVDDSEPPF